MTSISALLFRRALSEKVAETRKHGFVPLGSSAEKIGQQAPGPGGAPVDPAAGGAPMDPAMAGAPMDPMAGGAPMDPAMAGAPPMDPMAGGMPPEGGLPPMPEEMGLPPLPGEGEEGAVTETDADTVQSIQQNTMDLVRQTLEMVGKAKPQEAKPEEAAEAVPPPPEAAPGPVTGQPGMDPALFGDLGAGVGAPKVAQVLVMDEDLDEPDELARFHKILNRAEQAGLSPTPEFFARMRKEYDEVSSRRKAPKIARFLVHSFVKRSADAQSIARNLARRNRVMSFQERAEPELTPARSLESIPRRHSLTRTTSPAVASTPPVAAPTPPAKPVEATPMMPANSMASMLGNAITGYMGSRKGASTKKGFDYTSLLPTLAGAGIGGTVGAFRKKDKDESRIKSILRSAGTGAAVGLGSQLGAGLGGAVGTTTGMMLSQGGDTPEIPGYTPDQVRAMKAVGGMGYGDGVGTTAGGGAGGLLAYLLARRN